MPELVIPKVEKTDIKVPELDPGESAIILQRHERYDRDPSSNEAGSLLPEHAEAARGRLKKYFKELFSKDVDSDTMLLFVSSDTRYGENGHRSMETAQLAQDAAIEILEELGINPKDRIINLRDDYSVRPFSRTGQYVRPDKRLVEPKIFEVPRYVDFLREKYGAEEGPGGGISQKAWAMHEMDAEEKTRKHLGAEGVFDVIERTKKSLSVLARYARFFHQSNPNKKLVIWACSHYDTISPLVKDATNTGLDEYLPVDYGGGVVINLGSGERKPVLEAQDQRIPLELGQIAIRS